MEMKTSKLFDVYVGVWSKADNEHTPMLIGEYDSLAKAKRSASTLSGHWWVVERIERVVASHETEFADA